MRRSNLPRPRLSVMLALALVAAATITTAAAPARWKRLSPPPAMPEPAGAGESSIADFAMHWALYGDDKHPPLVLLHGGMGSGADFAAQIPALAARFRVIVPDGRGHGRSSYAASGLGYHVMAEDLIALFQVLGVERASLLGWSDGGIVALDLAINHPDRVARVVVTGTNFDRSGTRSAGKSATFSAYFARAVKEYKRLAPDLAKLDAFRKDLRAMWKREPAYTAAQLESIAAPLLVLHGEHDEIIRREHVERMVELVPHASLTVLPGVSHFAMWQAPEQFNQAALAFLLSSD